MTTTVTPASGRLSGIRVADAWVVRNLDRYAWFADLSVVVQMKHGPQLEVCREKSDDLSIAWDTIDVTVTPRPGWNGR